MNIAVFQFGQPWYSLASTSLIQGLKNTYKGCNIYWVTSTDCLPIFQYNSNIKEVYAGIDSFKNKCDLAINLTPSYECCSVLKNIDADEKTGFVLDDGKICASDKTFYNASEIVLGSHKTSKHAFQVIFRLAGLRWKGEGYNFSYYPRNKMHKSKTGVAIDDDSLRHFIRDNLSLEFSELWHVPIKQNLLKRVDEINRVKRIITNDLFCLHAAICLKKHVEFVDNKNYNMAVEFFGSGNHYRISK